MGKHLRGQGQNLCFPHCQERWGRGMDSRPPEVLLSPKMLGRHSPGVVGHRAISSINKVALESKLPRHPQTPLPTPPHLSRPPQHACSLLPQGPGLRESAAVQRAAVPCPVPRSSRDSALPARWALPDCSVQPRRGQVPHQVDSS